MTSLISRFAPNGLPRARRGPTRSLLGLAATAMAVAGAAACSPSGGAGESGAAEEDCTIAFSFLYSEIPVAEALKSFAADKAAEHGCELLTDNITGGKVDEQIASVDNFIAQGVDALVVQHLDPSPYGGLIERAKEAGIPYVSYFVPHPDQDGSVLFEQTASAELLSADAATWINENLDGQGKVLLMALTNDEGARAVTEKLEATILAETNAEVVAIQEALDQATGLQVAEDTLQAHPDLNVVLAWNDGGAMGAVEAFDAAGADPSKIYVASNQAADLGLLAMQDGNEYLKTLSVLSIRMLGEGIADVAWNVLQGEGEAELVVPQVLVHPEDTDQIAEFLTEYE